MILDRRGHRRRGLAGAEHDRAALRSSGQESGHALVRIRGCDGAVEKLAQEPGWMVDHYAADRDSGRTLIEIATRIKSIRAACAQPCTAICLQTILATAAASRAAIAV
jgi:hypothetical protein